jgi:Uma2 family endonuclease
MPTRLQPTTTGDLEADPSGHDYRLHLGQFEGALEAGIIPEGDGVELRDGFLCLKADPGHAHYRLDPAQYREMARLGILTTDDRIELLEGWLVAKMTKHRPHAVSGNRAFHMVADQLPAVWSEAKEDPVAAVDSEPEPDVSIIRGKVDDYLERTPGSGDVPLVIEVADTSLLRDRIVKKRLYARSGFEVY